MRWFVSLSLILLFVGCAAEPPIRKSVAAPVELGSITGNQIGVWPLDRKPTATWKALMGTRQKISRRDRCLVVTFQDAPIHEIRYFFGRTFSDGQYEDLDLKHTIVVFAQPKNGDDVILPKLGQVGVAPTRIMGLDSGNWLTTATEDADWVLRWLEGRVYSAVRAPAGRVMSDVLEYRGVADLEVSTTDRRKRDAMMVQLVQMRQPGVPDTGSWHADTAALADRFYGELLRPLRGRMEDVDRRMAKARTFGDRLDVFVDIRDVVIEAHFGTRMLPPSVAEWHQSHYASFMAALDKLFEGQFIDTGGVYGPYYQLRETISRRYWTSKKGRVLNKKRCQGVLDYAARFASIRERDPYRECARRLRWLRSSRTPPGTKPSYWAKVAKDQLLARTGQQVAEGYVAEIEAAIRRLHVTRSQGYAKLASQIEGYGCSVQYLAARFVSVANDLAMLQRCTFTHRALRPKFAALAAERLRRSCGGQPVVDQAVARAVARALGDKDAYEKTIANGSRLLAQARKLPSTGPMEARLDAYAQLATKAGQWGPACEYVAGELSVPAGRELAKKAAACARAGDHGRAALLYLNAATLGNRTAPAPTSTWSARRRYSALLAAEKKGELEGVDERVQWLIRARMHAYLVSVLSLPVTAADEPIYDLQDRYVAAQLAGRARLSTAFGLRLAGVADVRRKRKPEEDVRLVELGGKVVWRRQSEGGKIVDLSRYKIDRNGWRQYRKLRRELNAAEAEMRAAKKSSGTPRATLENQQKSLNEQITALNERIRQRAVNPATANAEIERLKRESSALSVAIRNYNRRNAHVREATKRFNEKVPPHNKLLSRLLQEQATAYAQLLQPSNTEFAERKIAGCGRGAEEQQARRWILGIVESSELASSVPVPHPSALASRVRDVSDPAIAAKDILDSLRRRRDDKRLWSGVSVEQHIEDLRDALVAYGRQYGTDDVFNRVMKSRVVPEDRYRQIQSFFTDEKRRAALKKRIDGT